MNASELLRIIDSIHREKNIDKEVVFQAIESALVSAAKKHYGEMEQVEVKIDRKDGSISAALNGTPLDQEETVGRIGAQTAKQVIIQKVREAERDSLYNEYDREIGQLVTGIVQRYENGTATVSLPNCEAILPRSEQIPGESHHVGERVKAVVLDVKKAGHRVKIVLTRTHPDFVRQLFETEIPEIQDRTIEIRAIAREAGVPMLPVVAGERTTRRQIGLYTILLVVVTLVFAVIGGMGPIYLGAALLLGAALTQGPAPWNPS